MATESTRLAAANRLLKRGVRFKLANAPFLLRLLRLNTINIHPFKAGTILELSRIIEIHDLENIHIPKDANVRLEGIARLVATAWLGDKHKIRRLTSLVVWFLLWQFPAYFLVEMYEQISLVNRTTVFMTITKYFEIHTQMMMNPKSLGQIQEGS